MSSSDFTATAANNNVEALDQIESLLKLFEVDVSINPTTQALATSKSLQEDNVYSGIHDSLTLRQYDILDRIRGDVYEEVQLDSDISRQEVDNDFATSTSRSSGVLRGQQVSTEPATSITLTVMTKTNDGARGGSIYGSIGTDSGRSVGTSRRNASAA